MSSGKLILKLTWRGENKRSAFFLPPKCYDELRNKILLYSPDSEKSEKDNFRVCWIDKDYDEIDIKCQSDYDIFLEEDWTENFQLYAEDMKPKSTRKKQPGMHFGVRCDHCSVKTIVGVRYKCLDCNDYDLCENCMNKNVHPNHIMAHIPNYPCSIRFRIALTEFLNTKI